MRTSDLVARTMLLFKPEEIVSVLHYGNVSGSDIDLLVILHADSGLSGCVHGSWDIAHIGVKQLGASARSFQPAITEPILTGRTIFGQNIDGLRNLLLDSRISQEDCSLIDRQSETYFDWSARLAASGHLDRAMQTLGFSLSYATFAQKYRHNPRVQTLASLKLTNVGLVLGQIKLLARHPEYLTARSAISALRTVAAIRAGCRSNQ